MSSATTNGRGLQTISGPGGEERSTTWSEIRLLTAVVEGMDDHVIVTDLDGIIRYVNPAFERVTGYTRAEAVGRTPAFLRSGEHRDAFYEELWRTLEAGETFQATVTNRRKNGSLFTEEKTITPLRGDDDRITHFVSIGKDVTERRRVEERLRQSQRLEAVGRLAGGIAHDFNNLLTAILGNAELLRERAELGPTGRHQVEEIIECGDLAAAVTSQLLAFSRTRDEEAGVRDLTEIVADTEMLVRRLLGERLRVRVAHTAEALPVEAGPGELEQIVLNLALNARDAMPDGGELVIEVGAVGGAPPPRGTIPRLEPAEGGFAVLRVSDTGQGMDPEIRDRIFDPFFTTKDPGQGTGLGLSTVYAIVRRLGGGIRIETARNEGTTFHVHLPLGQDADGWTGAR